MAAVRCRRTAPMVGLIMAVLASLVLTAFPATARQPASSRHSADGGASGHGPSQNGLAARAEREGRLMLLAEITSPGRRQAVAAQARERGGRNVRTFEHVPVVALSGTAGTIRALNANPHVVGVTEDIPQPPSLDSSLPVIDADDTRALGWTGDGQTVAILDTGIDDDHPFFVDNNGDGTTNRIISEACFSDPKSSGGDGELSLCPNGTSTDTTDANVDGLANCLNAGANLCDHGTHVAGIAAGDGTGLTDPSAPAAGVAPDADIIAIQVFTRFNSASACSPRSAPCVLTYPSDQIAGLNRIATLDGANPGWNITAANMSLGGGDNSTACDGDSRKGAIDTLLSAGIATVIAAGNDGDLNAVDAPACISTAVTVGATTDADNVLYNRGPLLDLFAPGFGVVSSVIDTFGSKNGTSMATPHVAGAFAVLREAYPSRTIGQLLSDMQATGVPITYDTAADGSTQATTPRLELLAALQQPNSPPSLGLDSGSVAVDEGQVATNGGSLADSDGDAVTLTASAGTVVDDGDGTWSWSLQTADGPADSQSVTITATDDKGESDTVTFDLVVENVAPTITSLALSADEIDEGGTVDVFADFEDPGWEDTYTATVDWGEGTVESVPVTITSPGGPGSPDEGTITASHAYGDDGTFPVTVTVADDDGGEATDDRDVTVNNVAPTITSLTLSADEIDEGGTVDVFADFEDPGWGDTYTATVDWGEGTVESVPVTITSPGGPGSPDEGTITASHAYGDDGTFPVTVTVADDDGGEATDDRDATVNNVDPDLAIDETDATTVQGTPTILAHVGETLDFAADVTDPGSDDLTVSWDWDDGAPAPDEVTTYLVNPPDPDPDPSPSVQPRDIRDETTHAFSDACTYDVVASASDDDGGSDDDTIAVVITGLADATRSKGYWQTQYAHDGQRSPNDLTDATLLCYLEIAQHVSAVFSETRSAATLAEAEDVLKTNGRSSAAELLDTQLLAAWLNFANGALDPDELVDTDGDGTVDATFADATAAAETVRNDASATREALLEQKDVLERINLRDETG